MHFITSKLTYLSSSFLIAIIMECSICFEFLGNRKSVLQGHGKQGEDGQNNSNDEPKPGPSSRKDKGHNSRWFSFFSKKSPDPDLTVLATPCGHLFHQRCIKTWLRRSGHPNSRYCPICRKIIQSDADLRIIFLDFTETCMGCAELKKEFQKLEKVHHEKCLHYKQELENALGEIKNSMEVNENLSQSHEMVKLQLETERERASSEAKNSQKRYDILWSDYQDLQEKYNLLKAHVPSAPDPERQAGALDDIEDRVSLSRSEGRGPNNARSTLRSVRSLDRPQTKRFPSSVLKFLCFGDVDNTS